MWPFSSSRFSSLKGRLVYAAVLPGILACALLSVGALWFVYSALKQQVLEQQRANLSIIGNLAQIPLLKNDTAALQILAQNQMGLADIRSIAFSNIDRKQITSIGNDHENFPAINSGITYSLQGNKIFWEWPIKNGDRTIIGWIQASFSTDALHSIFYRSIILLLLALLIVLSVTVVVASVLFRRTTYSFNQIQKKLSAISQGDFNIQLPAGDNEELNALIDSLNTAIHTFSVHQRELQEHIDQSTQDLRETLETIEIQNIELDLARKEALHASKVKSEFLANTSHEIRTPLNGIIGFTRLLLKDCTDTQQKDYLTTIKQSSENLLNLINDILDLSKIEAGKLVLEYESFNIRNITEETLQILAPSAHDKGLELAHVIDTDVPEYVFGDSPRIKQILTNLIGNAIKFSNTGSILVRIALEKREGGSVFLQCSVSDTGIGIQRSQLNKELFNAFSQASNLAHHKSGVGLGLAISKKLVDQMGGDIGIDSEENVGSTFWFTLQLDVDAQIHIEAQPDLTNTHFLIFDINRASRQSLTNILTGWHAQLSITTSFADILPTLSSNSCLSKAEWFTGLIVSIPIDTSDFPLEKISNVIQEAQKFCPVILHATNTFKYYLSKKVPAEIPYLSKPLTQQKCIQALQAINALKNEYIEKNKLSIPSANNHHHANQILVVDDNEANLKLLGRLLRDMGHTVSEANSGKDALQRCQQENFGFIFMDIRMPEMDGVETTRRIRMLNNRNKNIPVIAVTAHAMADQKQQFLLSGLDDYLSKPVDEDQLKKMLARWQNKKNLPDTTIDKPIGKKCVDLALSLQLSNGKAELATEMLGMLLNELPGHQSAINTALTENNFEQVLELIHKLHGACCYCGVPELKAICKKIEFQLNKKLELPRQEDLATFNIAVMDLLDWKEEYSIKDLFR